MRDMTEEEYDALDERLTKTTPILGHTGTGFFSRKNSQADCVDKNTEKIPDEAIASPYPAERDFVSSV